MVEPKKRSRRGARAAKKAERATPLSADERAVNPGMAGGRFAPLSGDDVEKINNAVMDVLENIGLSQAIPSCVDAVVKGGGSTAMEDCSFHAHWLKTPSQTVQEVSPCMPRIQSMTLISAIRKCTSALRVPLCISLMYMEENTATRRSAISIISPELSTKWIIFITPSALLLHATW